MDATEIQKRIDVMPAAMTANGLLKTEAEFELRANAEARVMLKWWKGPRDWDSEYKWLRGSQPEAVLAEADAFIAGMPSAEETKRSQFLEALGRVIDLGCELGQDVGPLASEMRRLSDNAITDQRVAA